MYNEGIKTFKAGEDLIVNRLVKIESATVTSPPEIVYADAGEDAIGSTVNAADDGDMVSVRMLNDSGTHQIECLVDSDIARGTSLYAGASGVVTDASSGSVVGIALEAGVDNAIIEVAIDNRKPTTAAGTTITDTGTFTDEATVEAALAEIYQHIQSAQNFIPIPLTTVLESDATNATALTGSTTPVLDMADGDTDSGIVLTWESSNSDAIVFQTPLPPNLDVASDVVVHLRAKSGGAVDTPIFSADTYFNEGDTKVEDDSAALSSSYAEKTITIAASDVPAGAQTMTVELTPGAHTTDTIVLSAIWVEYTGTTLTS